MVISNTLQGHLVYLLRVNGPLQENQLVKILAEDFETLRKPTGEAFKANVSQTVRSVLNSSAAF